MLEQELVEKLIKRDLVSIRQFVNQYNRRLFSMVFRYVRNKEDAEDILQEAWVKFFNSLSRFKGGSKLYTYLYRIAMNEALSHLRKYRLKKLLTLEFREKPDTTTPESLYLENEKFRLVDESVRALPDRQKQIFILRRSEDLSFKEIGEILKISENNAKVGFFYALQNIRKMLKERGAL